MKILSTQARAKVNLCLFLGPLRPDGRHEVVTLMDSLTLADEVRMVIGVDALAADEVVCAGVQGPNLAAAALAAFRAETKWDGPPVRLEIDKRVPIAAELRAGDVYHEADRLGLCRDALGLARSLTRVQAALSSETVLDRVHNDLQDAACSLCPAIEEALEATLTAGADHAIVSGSG